MPNDGVTQSSSGLAQTNGAPVERIAGVVGTVPAPGQLPQVIERIRSPQVGDRQGPGDSQQEEAPPTREQWIAYQSTKDTEVLESQRKLAEAQARVAELEQSNGQITLQQRVHQRASEWYAWAAQDPAADLEKLGEWAVREATKEITAWQEAENDKRDATTYRQSKSEQQRDDERGQYLMSIARKLHMSVDQFRTAMEQSNIRYDDPQWDRKVYDAAVDASLLLQGQQRYDAANTLVNSVAWPGAQAAGDGGDLLSSIGSMSVTARRGTPEYEARGKQLKAAWKLHRGED